jgi:hypothetical protein
MLQVVLKLIDEITCPRRLGQTFEYFTQGKWQEKENRPPTKILQQPQCRSLQPQDSIPQEDLCSPKHQDSSDVTRKPLLMTLEAKKRTQKLDLTGYKATSRCDSKDSNYVGPHIGLQSTGRISTALGKF